MSESGFGALVIGDELLTGRRVDKHVPKLIETLDARGLELSWAHTVGDDPTRLTAALRWSLSGDDIVFCFGGIGATPDDRTRQCAAAAAGVGLEFNEQGRAELESVFGERTYPARIHMVEWPAGAQLLPNPVNRVPGFSLGDHHFVPGFPSMAWPMVAWVLDERYTHLHREQSTQEYLLEALDTPESDLIGIMQAVMDEHPAVRLSCLPDAGGRRAIEFGIRGPRADAERAYASLSERLTQRQVVVRHKRPPEPD